MNTFWFGVLGLTAVTPKRRLCRLQIADRANCADCRLQTVQTVQTEYFFPLLLWYLKFFLLLLLRWSWSAGAGSCTFVVERGELKLLIIFKNHLKWFVYRLLLFLREFYSFWLLKFLNYGLNAGAFLKWVILRSMCLKTTETSYIYISVENYLIWLKFGQVTRFLVLFQKNIILI